MLNFWSIFGLDTTTEQWQRNRVRVQTYFCSDLFYRFV